jgi:CCR4-NOT transcriptional complex subunit CAF120
MEGNQFREPESTLQKGKLEGWAKVRIGGGTEWQRLWIVISLYAVSGSIDVGRAGSPNGSTKKNRLSGFLSGSKSTPSLSGHGCEYLVSRYIGPTLILRASPQQRLHPWEVQ